MFIPIRDDVPTLRKPVLTISLIAINTLVFLYSVSLGTKGFQILTYQFGYIPYELTTSHELIPELAVSPIFTAFSSMFMHGGWLHLIGNMLFLWIYGRSVEDYFGPVKFTLFYLVSGLAAITLYTLFDYHSQVPLIGASGAISGVMGAYLILHPRAKITVLIIFFFIQFVQLPATIVLGFFFVYQLLMSLMDRSTGGGVAYMAHIGGFVFGYLLLKVMVRVKGRGTTPSGGQRIYRVKW